MTHQTNEYHPAMEWESLTDVPTLTDLHMAREAAEHWRTAYDDLHYRVDCLLERVVQEYGRANDEPDIAMSLAITTKALAGVVRFAAEFRSPTTMKKDTNEAGSTERRLVPRLAGSEPGDASDELERRVLILEWRVGCLVTHLGGRNPNLQAALDRGPKL